MWWPITAPGTAAASPAAIAEPYLRPGQIEEHLVYPVTTETTDHPGGYAGAMEDFYPESAERIAAHLDAGPQRGAAGRG